MTAPDIHAAIDAIFRIESARLIAGLARIVRDVGVAEELAQDALVIALERWPASGVPDNPGAWLMAAAKHRAIDHLRRKALLERKQGELGHEIEARQEMAAAALDAAIDEDVGDDLLRLMFISCHPILSSDARVALTLHLLGGLTVGEIARAYLVAEPTIAQRVVRAKRTLAEARVPFEVPRKVELAARLSSVLEVLYLVFNEGYSATAGDDWMRPALCEDALRLGRILAGLVPNEPEIHGLVALMEIQASRSGARIGPSGEPILLLEQDRARWDQLLIRRGLAALARAEELGGALGPYALQAAIAACHARARTPAETDWPRIAELYGSLARVAPSPVVELNRAVAVAMAFGPAAGLELVDVLTSDPSLESYHLLPGVRGDLLAKLGRLGEARAGRSRRGRDDPGGVAGARGYTETNTMQRHRHDLRAIARRVMIERGLLPDFSPAVVAETNAFVAPAVEPNPSIRDHRELLWVSIDNDDSRDLDQLSFAEAAGPGTTRVLVAIADVDALVTKNSAIDEHAAHNTTSVYTSAEIFPMLPARLSTDKTSLGEDQERPAIVVEMLVSGDGSVVKSDVYRAAVLNHAKLAYDSVAAWLEGRGPAPGRVATAPGVDAQLRLQDSVAQALRTVRHQQGALSLETIEPRAVFDGDVLADLRLDEKNRAKELIEDLMIAANGVTARFLAARGLPSLRRVLRSPERWERIVQLAAGLNETLPAEPDAAALEAFLCKRRRVNPDTFPDLSLAVVKLIGRGEYVVEVPGGTSPGHFGLAVRDYTHSTAPNRRFPDLVTLRLLKTALTGRPASYGRGELEELARHCTEQEDNANKVERQVRKSAAALLLEPRIGERFKGMVTAVSEKGTWVRIFRPPVEGKMVDGFEGLDVGEKVTVELLETDVERGFIDFARRG